MEKEPSAIEKYLEKELKQDQSKLEQELAPIHKYVFATEILEKKLKSQSELPKQMIFKPSFFTKVSISVVAIAGLLGSIFLMAFFPEKWIGILVIILVCCGLLIKVWVSAPVNVVKLDSTGITHNDKLFKWSDINSSHILYIETSNDNESYLILELDNNQIKKLELTNIKFSTSFSDSSSDDEAVFGHYIERYKSLGTE